MNVQSVKALVYRARQRARRLLERGVLKLVDKDDAPAPKSPRAVAPKVKPAPKSSRAAAPKTKPELSPEQRLQHAEQLQHAARLGDRVAFGLLARRYRPELKGFAARLFHSVGEASPIDAAEDAVQEAFYKILRRLSATVPEDKRPLPALPYFYAAVRSTVYDVAKKDRRRRLMLVGNFVNDLYFGSDPEAPNIVETPVRQAMRTAHAEPDAYEVLQGQERQAAIHQALTLVFSNLNKNQRRLAQQRFIDGLSLDEIARLEQESPAAIKKRLERLRARARYVRNTHLHHTFERREY